ncbi:MAG: DUF2520 domain-containing protein [Chitinophagaceae bacterium]|nr:DUF2520 domain-containing protein [Chitinophagaceae bacterium]
MNVVIIGTGNVATVLGRKIKAAGHTILQVISRNIDHAYALADLLGAGSNNYFSAVRQDADIYIIAVSDDAIPEVAAQLLIDNGIVVHTAGAVSKKVLEKSAHSFGVLYPLQSLSAQKEDIPQIPLLIDGNTDETIIQIEKFALTLSGQVQYADDEMRQKLHVGAVIVNNFTNYLYTLTDEFCKKENINFKLLLPLLTETVQRLQYDEPALLQTGPAKRGDTITIQKQLSILKTYPVLHQLYQEFSRYIIDYYKKYNKEGIV